MTDMLKPREMSLKQLAEIEDRCVAATPAPWKATTQAEKEDGWLLAHFGDDYATGSWDVMATLKVDEVRGADADATFVAHARTDLPACVAEIRRLRDELALAEIERIREMMRQGRREGNL